MQCGQIYKWHLSPPPLRPRRAALPYSCFVVCAKPLATFQAVMMALHWDFCYLQHHLTCAGSRMMCTARGLTHDAVGYNPQ